MTQGKKPNYNVPQDSIGVIISDVSAGTQTNAINIAGVPQLTVVNAIDQTNFDLNASAFSETTAITNDYIFDSIELNFSTTESKTITITSTDGTILLGGTVDTSAQNLLRNTTKQHFNLVFNQSFNANDNITVTVSQYTSAGTMDCILKIREGSATLGGNPVLGAGSNLIGSVKISDGTDTVDVANVDNVKALKVVSGIADEDHIHLRAQDVTATKGFMLIDLSDTTKFPHTNTGHINISWLNINVNPSTNFQGDILLGFLTSVDATNGDFNIIEGWHFEKQSIELAGFLSFNGLHFNANVDDWFGPTIANDAIWQTDVNIEGPDGTTTFPSGNGDLVMLVQISAGSVDVGMSIGYTTVVDESESN